MKLKIRTNVFFVTVHVVEKSGRPGLSPSDLKVACYRKLIGYLPRLTRRQIDLIIYAVETYISLSNEENQHYQRLIREVYPEVNKMITNPLIEQGIQQGRYEGTLQAKQETLTDLMQLKFGALPPSIRERIQSMQAIDQLDTFLRRVLTANRLEQMGLTDGFGRKPEV